LRICYYCVMGSPKQPAASSTAAPADQRTCVKCNETKTVTPESWPYRKGRTGVYAAQGARCMACEKIRKQEYEARRDKIAALVSDVPAAPAGNSADKAKQNEAVKTSKLDVAKALKAGSRVLNDYSASVLARVLMWAEDEQHENHLWAVQFMAERILPRKLYEELGAAAAGVGSLQDKRPMFTIQVLPATPEQPQGRIIEHDPIIPVLPAPAQSNPYPE
jgi:hypothetical protein